MAALLKITDARFILSALAQSRMVSAFKAFNSARCASLLARHCSSNEDSEQIAAPDPHERGGFGVGSVVLALMRAGGLGVGRRESNGRLYPLTRLNRLERENFHKWPPHLPAFHPNPDLRALRK